MGRLSKTLALAITLCLMLGIMPLQAADLGYAMVATSGNYTLALTKSGVLYGWGDNYYGQLGIGNKVSQSTPVKIMSGVKYVVAGPYHAFAITDKNELYGWGDNAYGRLGLGEKVTSSLTPVKVMDNVSKVAAGAVASLIIKTDGDMYGVGVLRYVVSDTIYEPKLIASHVADASVGTIAIAADPSSDYTGDTTLVFIHQYIHYLYVTEGGELYGWGDNTFGQLGTGDYKSKDKEALLMENIKAVSATGAQTYALDREGVLYAFGDNSSGLLGSGDAKPHNTPVKIMEGVANIVSASAHVSAATGGSVHAFALTAGGDLYAWGQNEYGKLGTGNKNNRNAPTKIMSDVASVSAGATHTAIVAKDGTLYVCGGNANGQLGLGRSSALASPTKAMDLLTGKSLIDTSTVPPDSDLPPVDADALPTSQKITIDGSAVELEAYNIGGANYLKLRDVAQALAGTAAEFEVQYDDNTKIVTVIRGSKYTPVGGELTKGDGTVKHATLSNNLVKMGEKYLSLNVYKIDGANYFKLRDLGEKLGFGVDYDAGTRTVIITTK